MSATAPTAVGVFGGSFDPPHAAHLELARTVLAHGAAQLVLFVPCFRHPLGKTPAAFAHRLAMCALLVEGEPGMEVSPIEASLAGEGRTIELVAALEAARPGQRLRLIAGADIYFERVRWYRFDEIERRAPPIYVARSGVAPIPEPALPAPADVSSSGIRAQIAAGRAPAELLPLRVAEYVARQRLYGWRG